MRSVTVYIDEEMLQTMAELVRVRKFPSRSELIRAAIRDLLDEQDAYLGELPIFKNESLTAKTLDNSFSED